MMKKMSFDWFIYYGDDSDITSSSASLNELAHTGKKKEERNNNNDNRRG